MFKYIFLTTENEAGEDCNCWSLPPNKNRQIKEYDDGRTNVSGSIFLYKNKQKRDNGKRPSGRIDYSVDIIGTANLQAIYEAIILQRNHFTSSGNAVDFISGVIT